MASYSISQVAEQIGVRPSAIRYYEEIGLLVPAVRVSGQRRYDRVALHRLALIRRAAQAGFTLDEIRGLFYGFERSTPAGARWRKLAQTKLAELDERIRRLREMRAVLLRLQGCECGALDQCGERIFRKTCASK